MPDTSQLVQPRMAVETVGHAGGAYGVKLRAGVHLVRSLSYSVCVCRSVDEWVATLERKAPRASYLTD